jgi:hypothetical protein
VLNLMPMFIVMSALAIFLVRRSGLWRGIGGAWLATFVIVLAIVILSPDWSIDCGLLGAMRSGVGHVTAINPSPNGCVGDNSLPLWLVALPPLVGIGIAAVLVGQLNENLALLFVVAVAAAAYAWPRLQRQHAA